MITFKEFIRINESPEILDMPEDVVDPGIRSMSPEALKREYFKIYSSGNIDIYFQEIHNGISIRGVDSRVNQRGRHDLVLDLLLYKNIFLKDFYQVNSVWVKQGFRNNELSQMVYYTLVSMGYKLMSDYKQLIGGVGLWKSIIKNNTKYKIRVYSFSSKEFVVFNGKTELNQSNIQPEEIWKTNSDGRDKVLIMTKK